ncbi:MAG: hypothetical protein ACPF8V_10570, partial [Luteibaculum sp.]
MIPAQLPLIKIALAFIAAVLMAIYFPFYQSLVNCLLVMAILLLFLPRPKPDFLFYRGLCWVLISFCTVYNYTAISWLGLSPDLPEKNKAIHKVEIWEVKQQDSLRFRA